MLGTKAIENILRHELDNWLRWGKKRDWMPISFTCMLGRMYVSRYPIDAESRVSIAKIDEISAAQFERIIVALPERHRQAFVIHHLEKCVIDGCIKKVRDRDDAARCLGVGKSQYHAIVNQAHSIVLREATKIDPRLALHEQ